ncbi:MAG: ATP-dependent helicase UvrD/PcrA, partial [Thermomicrobiales bacterium]|nr:ATP-dependent helicase UvrD/PcrA [Thermomicrobiales bacterium]
AQKLLYLTYTGVRMSYGRYQQAVPSRFLAVLPQDNIRSLGTRSTSSRSGGSSLADRARGLTSQAPPASRPSAVATAPPPVQRLYKVGERVFHAKFGEGVIAQTEQRRNDQDLAIDFVRHGRKRLLASLAPLEVLTD